MRILFPFLGALALGLCPSGVWSAEEVALSEAADPPLALPANTSEIMQKEIDRRRETNIRLTETLDLSERLYRAGQWEAAEAKYQAVLQATSPRGPLSGYYERAKLGLARCLAARALAKKDSGDLAEAAGLMKQASEADPRNRTLARQAKDLQEEAARNQNPYPGNSAATEDLVTKVAEVKRLLSLADQLEETGQLRAARKRLDDVLRIDPYNRAALKKIEKIEDQRMNAADERYAASREKALAQVSEAWLPPPPASVDPKKSRATQSASASNAAAILQSLADIRIPELLFSDKPIRAAVEELQRLSEQYDPKKQGINFVLRLPPPGGGRDPETATVSLELRDISLQVALKYLCDQVRGGDKLRYEVEDNAVFLLPTMETGGDLEIRSYSLPPSLVANLKSVGTDPRELGNAVLKNIGVNTEVMGASATCFRDTGKLVVRNTPSELNKIEQRLRDTQGEPPQKQFEVETKFLQFSDNELKNFTFNLAMQMNQNNRIPRPDPNLSGYNPGYNPGTPGATGALPNANGGTSGLRGTAGLNQNGVSVTALQNLLDPTFPQDASNQIGINAQVLGRGFSAFVQLLQNALGRDLVAAPRVTLADGKDSKIVISREMYYPTSYTQPTVPNNDQGVGAGFILPPNPTGFEARQVGVTLSLTARSTAIPKAVDLDFTQLSVEDFEGFLDYGTIISSVTDPAQTGQAAPTVAPQGNAPFLVPVFSKRSLETRVRLLDGETVGLGGLISESVQAVDDKVPGLGDIPLFGRLFRSEASQKVKLNLVVFCTLRIINPDGSLRFAEDEENVEYAQSQSAEMMPSVP